MLTQRFKTTKTTKASGVERVDRGRTARTCSRGRPIKIEHKASARLRGTYKIVTAQSRHSMHASYAQARQPWRLITASKVLNRFARPHHAAILIEIDSGSHTATSALCFRRPHHSFEKLLHRRRLRDRIHTKLSLSGPRVTVRKPDMLSSGDYAV